MCFGKIPLHPCYNSYNYCCLQFDQGGLSKDLPVSLYLGNGSHPSMVAYREYMRSIARALGATPARTELFVNQTYQFEVALAKVIYLNAA